MNYVLYAYATAVTHAHVMGIDTATEMVTNGVANEVVFATHAPHSTLARPKLPSNRKKYARDHHQDAATNYRQSARAHTFTHMLPGSLHVHVRTGCVCVRLKLRHMGMYLNVFVRANSELFAGSYARAVLSARNITTSPPMRSNRTLKIPSRDESSVRMCVCFD